MFDLNEYKEELVNFYRWKIDDSIEEKNKRRKMLEGRDEDLLKILLNTEEFIYFLLTKMKEENNIFENHIFITLDLEGEEATPYYNAINLNLRGGWPSDTFFRFDGKLISFKLLRKIFKNFQLECSSIDNEICGGDIGWIESRWEFCISGPIKDFNELYDKIRELKRVSLINALKRIRTNKTI